MKAGTVLLPVVWLAVLASSGCVTPRAAELEEPAFVPYPPTRFVVFADPHLFDPSLASARTDTASRLPPLKRLIAESEPILRAALERVAAEEPDFVLVCGDLTKDGEESSHILFAEYLDRLESSGIPVLVVPGNHDVLNSRAVRYDGETEQRVAWISPERFRDIYAEFGFRQAIALDPSSLSYVAEPVSGLWVLALDSCRYREQEDKPLGSGRIYPETLRWLEGILVEARSRRKAVIVFLHHEILEHYAQQRKYFPDTVIANGSGLSRLLAARGVRVAFTGHEHAHDIRFDGSLYDVATGSLIGYPCPYRTVEISPEQVMSLGTRYIDAHEKNPEGFRQHARESFRSAVVEMALSLLAESKVRALDAQRIAEKSAQAFLAHHGGDEAPPASILDTSGIGWWGRVVFLARRSLFEGLWNDPEPPDNKLSIDLKTGDWRLP